MGRRHGLRPVPLSPGGFRAADSLFQQALTIYTTAYHGVDRRSSATRLGLARFYVLQGQPAKAEPILRDVLRIEQQDPRPTADRIAAAEDGLGSCLAALGRYVEAESLLLSSLRGAEHTMWAQRRQVLRDLVALYDRWQKPADADRYRAQLDAPPLHSATP